MDRLSRTSFLIDLPDQIEQGWIHSGDFIASPVAHEPVELAQACSVELAVALIGDGCRFFGMGVVKRQ